MAMIGQKLLQPESGWRRFDDNNENINYEGGWLTTNSGVYYNNTLHYNPTSNSKTIKFNFIGSKIRLITSLYSAYGNNIPINIDGNIEYYSNNGSTLNQVLTYEKANLVYKEHFVEITTISGMDFDAIDIDLTGELKPYNSIFNKFLIKQNNQYYSIKPEFYSNGVFIPITLSSGDTPNDDDFNNNGFDDIDSLCDKNNVEDDTVVAEDLESGKLFTFDMPNSFKNVTGIV